MGFFTKVDYSRQLRQSGNTDGVFSGNTQNRGWFAANVGNYTGWSGYEAYTATTNPLSAVSFLVGSHTDTSGTSAVTVTSYSGLASGVTVLSLGMAPLYPVNQFATTPTLTASTFQIHPYDLLTSGGDGDLELDVATGNVIYNGSSRRYKYDINNINFSNLDKLLSLQPRTFKWKSNHKEDWGLIAEEVDELGFKELVNYSNNQPESVQYKKVALALLEYIKVFGVNSKPVECNCEEDEFIVADLDGEVILDSSKSLTYIVKSFANVTIKPDKGLIDKKWGSLELLPESSIIFKFCKKSNCWMIVSSDGIKES
tara:strand:+ start:657 stop:1595 length:939 start_codon:yes stop_codon:yes gene_type:complete